MLIILMINIKFNKFTEIRKKKKIRIKKLMFPF